MSTVSPNATPTYRALEDDDRSRLSQRLRVVLLTLLATCPVVSCVGYWLSNPQMLWTSLVGIVVSAMALALNRAGACDAAVLLLLMGMLVAATATTSVGESVHDSGMILYPTIIVVGSLLLQARANQLLVAARGRVGHARLVAGLDGYAPRRSFATSPTSPTCSRSSWCWSCRPSRSK